MESNPVAQARHKFLILCAFSLRIDGNRTPLCVPQSNKNFVLAHSFSSYATQYIFASGPKARGKNMVEMMGIEPMTPCLQGRCSPS